PELNCCSVNGPRTLGMLAEWALMRAEDGPVLNYYGPGVLSAHLRSGNRVQLRQRTAYPRDGKIELAVSPERAEEFTLRLRVPQWSARTRVSVNGEPAPGAEPGRYLALTRKWEAGDKVELELDIALHFWAGEREQAGKTSVYQGPILLAYDQRYNTLDPEELPRMDAAAMKGTPAAWSEWPAPWLLLSFRAADGRELRLCDFASAGAAGTQYRSWLPVTGVAPRPFRRERAVWVG
ncbi:MAG TPA: hypothetical protein VFU47_14390, partial [Armatimonadota bacterium]|nr:hypothetical protein [Armatimonadota bacterium]